MAARGVLVAGLARDLVVLGEILGGLDHAGDDAKAGNRLRHDAAAGEFEVQDVGLVALGEAGGLEHDGAKVLGVPHEGEGGGAGGAFAADDFAMGVREFAADGDVVGADKVGGGEVEVGRGRAVFEDTKSEHEASTILAVGRSATDSKTWVRRYGGDYTEAGEGVKDGREGGEWRITKHEWRINTQYPIPNDQ